MSIHFTKMQGLGNDFMLINALTEPFNLSTQEIKRLADRRYGVGFDQLLVLEPASQDQADFYYRIYNADGSQAEQCGNGLRCIARYVRDHHLTERNPIRLACKGGLMEAEIEDETMVKVNMGTPIFTPKDIPCTLPTQQLIYNITVDGTQIHMGLLSMGNPHAVICVDDLAHVDIEAIGQAVSNHSAFPQRINVGFLQVTQPYHALLEVFERGAGKTLACGSGACAAMVYGHRLGILEREVSIIQPGGELFISWAGGDNPVYMTGPAVTVFEGKS